MAAAAVTSPTRVLELDTHSSSEFGPSESSLPLVPEAPMVSPFLCSDDPEPDTELPERHISFAPHDAMLARWRIRDILVGRLYRTYPGGPCRALTARKLVRPLPSHRLASKTSRYSEAYRRWRSTQLSTMYPLTTSESSVGDSSFESSARPSQDSITEDIDADVLADIEANIATAEAATGMDVEAGTEVGISIEANVRVDREYEVDSSPRGTIEVGMDRVIDPVVANDIDEPITSLERRNAWLRGTLRMESERVDRNEIQTMETELWNLTVNGNDLDAYTQRFQELTMLCTKMVPEEEDQVEKYIGGLLNNIQVNVVTAEPTRLQDAVMIAIKLMDQKLKGYDVRNAENKRRGKEYVLGGGETNLDSNVVTGTFLLNNHYASMLFDLGADGIFVSSIFSALLDVISSILDVSYAAELADERVAKTSTTVEVNLRGLLGLGKMNSVVMNVRISLVLSDLSPSSPS
nr:reverse transcriptase domain-containing protein [Tanacetum cinerariifolium]